MKLNDENRTVIGFIIFIFCLLLGLVLAAKEEEIESDDKD